MGSNSRHKGEQKMETFDGTKHFQKAMIGESGWVKRKEILKIYVLKNIIK